MFFSEKELADVLQNLPNNGLRDFAEWASLMGQRKSEAAGLTWNMIDGNELRIPGELYKKGKGRVIPFGPELSAIIARRRKVARVEIGGAVEFNQYIFRAGAARPRLATSKKRGRPQPGSQTVRGNSSMI